MAGPHFFVDRSLGRRQVPNLLREAGWDLETLSEHYGIPDDESVVDVEWLRLAGEHRWPVLMKDERIRYRPAEREALLTHGVRAFCITSGNLTARQMAEQLIVRRDAIWREAVGSDAALFAISTTSMRKIDLQV